MSWKADKSWNVGRILESLLLLCLIISGPVLMGADVDSHKAVKDSPHRIACIGNSVTYGLGLHDRETESYPSQLQKILGENFVVGNFGVNGTTLLTKGHRPYIQSEAYHQALDYKADIVVIDLGLNDTDPRNWPLYRDDFTRDYLNLIHSFKTMNGKTPKVYICLMTPIFHSHPRFKSGTRDWFWQIQKKIELVAKSCGAELIDLHTPLYSRPDLFADALHPDIEGAGIIAKTISSAITGDYGGFKLSPAFSEHMVLQRNQPIELSGTANRQDHIKLNFAGKSSECTTGFDGKWHLALPQTIAGGPYNMQILVNGKIVVDWNDILIGEVWFCSGQSNMAFRLDQSQNGKDESEKVHGENLRLLNFQGITETSDTKWDSTTLKKVNQLFYFQGEWKRCSPKEASSFSAIAYHFGQELRERLHVPVGLILVAVGGAPAEAFIDRYTLEHHPQLVNVLYNWSSNDFIMEWCRQRAMVNISSGKNPLQRHPYMPAYVFEAGISAFRGFPVKGILWYQGESNAHNMEHHEVVFPELIRSWRQFCKNDKLPFVFAQLSSIQRPGWELFRDSQRRMAGTIPNCYMAITSDLGDSLNVHPIHKKEVGHRLALQALQKVYGQSVKADGPIPLKATRIEKSRVEILFGQDQSLQTSDGQSLLELDAAGSDEVFYPISGELKGNKITIINKNDQVITQVRYGWRPFSRGNLVNSYGLPASTFSLNVK
ncbi:MAG: GDSL-type esterase/lipase family protein [Mariniphaga sp.]